MPDSLKADIKIKCSYYEIYNEQIFDLVFNYLIKEKDFIFLILKKLTPKHQQEFQALSIREDLKRGAYVEGLNE